MTPTSTPTATPQKCLPPINIMQWVEKHRDELKPPVSNKYLYDGADFFVMVIAGPNARNDFHVTNSEEYFYQVKGDIVVRIREDGVIKDMVVREGETFFIPANVPHSPTRPPDTIGVVVERVRPAGETEHLQFYCDNCHALVHDLEFDCADIVNHFSRAMKEFWNDADLSTCAKCNTRITPGKPVKRITFDDNRTNVTIEREA